MGGILVTAFRNPGGQQNDRYSERKIQEEDPTPCGMFDQPATEDRAERSSDRGKPGPGADGLSSRAFWKGRRDQREAPRYQQSRSQALNRARPDQHVNVLS